jgi:hypothetical protein
MLIGLYLSFKALKNAKYRKEEPGLFKGMEF